MTDKAYKFAVYSHGTPGTTHVMLGDRQLRVFSMRLDFKGTESACIATLEVPVDELHLEGVATVVPGIGARFDNHSEVAVFNVVRDESPAPPVESTGSHGFSVARVLPELEGTAWNKITRAYMRSLRPSSVRVIPNGAPVKSDAQLWRVTVFLDALSNIDHIMQEVEVDLPEGVPVGHALKYELRKNA